ncbi:hypothetical protein V6255_09655 [Psychromonas arctica]|uniref:Uncharacterized protein n=1 Tax=Psychromonas arctica TaxID=168275 RepID=A0ABU9HBZ0_9GAMM
MNKTMAYKVILLAMLCLSINVSATNAKVDSREYKILLNPSLFTGDESVRISKISDYWKVLKSLIEKGALKSEASGYLSLDKSRTVSFYDVQGSCDLLNAGYSFRERVENGKRKVTLKFRSADQLLASAQDLRGTKSKAKSKFEEDVAVPFISTYSSSTTQKIGNSKNLNKMNDPIGLYPGLKNKHFDENLAIEKVSDLTINEYVYKSANIDIVNIAGVMDTEFSLSLWYNESVSTTQAIVVEISFKSDNEHEKLNKNDSRNISNNSSSNSSNEANHAKELFMVMQENPLLAKWNSTDSLSKTATVYQYDSRFCN